MNKALKAGIVAFAFAAAALLTTRGLAAGEANSITVKGSDTMVNMASGWAEAYMGLHPEVQISVTGGGSGTGIAALINGTTDICNASRQMAESEIQTARRRGINPVRTVVARDGLAVIVNPRNPVSELTMEQIGKIYTGAYTNWHQVGGPDHRIVVLSRENSSGTYVFFQEHVLNKQDYTQSARLMPATSAIVQATTNEQWAIGYVGLGYAEKARNQVKILKVKRDAHSPGVLPSLATVDDGTYSISRPLQIYTNGEPTGAIRAYVGFILSAAGQKIVEDYDEIPVRRQQ